MQTIKLSDFKKAIDDYINTYGDKEIFSVINHNTDKHYTICFTKNVRKAHYFSGGMDSTT